MNGLVVVLIDFSSKQIRIIVPDIERAGTEDRHKLCLAQQRQLSIQNCQALWYTIIGSCVISNKMVCFLYVLADNAGALFTIGGNLR